MLYLQAVIASEEKDMVHVKELAQLRESVEQRARTLAVRNLILNLHIYCRCGCSAASAAILRVQKLAV